MPSPLSFASTEDLRKKLLVKNLPTYSEEGFTGVGAAGIGEFATKFYSVIDSPDVETVGDVEEVKLYVTNKYGPANVTGYGNPIQLSTLVSGSNAGEYTGVPTQKDVENATFIDNAFIQNTFGPPDGYDDIISINDVQNIIQNRDTYFKFVSSYYSPGDILFKTNPVGSSGTLSQDSVMIQIAAKSLKDEFQYRIDEQTRQETLGRANFLNALQDPFIAADIIRGTQELIEPDWHISVPGSIVGKGLDFISRLTGAYAPFSWIPGDYFATTQKTSFVNQAINYVGRLVGVPDLLPTTKSGSDIFLNSTGRGQSSTLFKTLEYNQYRPDYKANFISDLNLSAPNGNYYIGKRTQDPNDILFPNNELPVNQFGKRVQTAVRGYGELGKLYEGTENKFKFGLDTVEPDNGPGLQGGFTWVSPKSRDAAGLKVSQGGAVASVDENYNAISSQFKSSESLNYKLTPGSILDDTQRLVDAADGLQGNARLSHVGNAINQVSKVFNDGTREITKGSRVRRYVNEGGIEVGKEYCRVFTKDNPYYVMNDLQKSEGNIRKMTYSVLDNTYNLNIAPLKGTTSTNIVDGQVKKYMLSLENLSWRTSSMQQDLPPCEKGPSGGRIMWFPPYDLKVDESVSVRWNTNEFLGRPEPVYTYNNTQRQGSLSFKMIVDHPSVLNTLVDKELANVTPDSEVTKIVDSFFAGCKTLDIYDLAKKYGQLSFNDIYEVVTKTSNPETYKAAIESLPPKEVTGGDVELPQDIKPKPDAKQFEGIDLFFANDIPGPQNKTSTTANQEYDATYNDYIAAESKYLAEADKLGQKQQVQNFFNEQIKKNKSKYDNMINEFVKLANDGYAVDFQLIGSASSPNTPEYNDALSKRRVDSVGKQVINDPRVVAVNSGSVNKITFGGAATGELGKGVTGNDCTEDASVWGGYTKGSQLYHVGEEYSVQAMGCRRTQVVNIIVIDTNPNGDPPIKGFEEVDGVVFEGSDGQSETPPTPAAITTTENKLREGITKKLLRKLLSECDYFESITDDTSFLYEGIKEKIKYFSPAFHSMTPEGLNSRLTFLQQCLRPGNTIPTIGPDGKPMENDALNTSFGAPPICVLRVGDFFHTKIAINQMSVRYDPLVLDLNPEGIGVQPMIADVSLSFYFIGGHGLKEPVAQLQNALSFNYYANTEVYDERAVSTEDTSNIDLKVIEEVYGEIPFTVNNVQNQQTRDGGNTIGTIVSENTTNSGTTTTGTLSYKTIMDELITSTSEYNTTLINTFKDVNDVFGQSGLMMFTKDRGYVDGYVTTAETPTKLFGKSESLQKKIDKLFDGAISDVNSGDSPFLNGVGDSPQIKNKDIRKYKTFVKELITQWKNTFTTGMNSFQEDLIQNEQNLITVIDKVNVVDELVDGYINNKGNPIVYILSATTEVAETSTAANTLGELEDDITIISEDLNNILTTLEGNSLLTDNFNNDYTFDLLYGNISGDADIRFLTMYYKEILEKNTEFKNVLIKFVENEKFENLRTWIAEINRNFDLLNSQYLEQKNLMDAKFKENEDSELQQKFNTYEPYTKGKSRHFTFEYDKTPGLSKKKLLKDLYSGLNEGQRNKWNGKVKLD